MNLTQPDLPPIGGWKNRLSMLTRVLLLAYASLGPKPGKKRVRAMLLKVDELPGAGWQTYSRQTLRAGVGGHTPELQRARDARKVSAAASFVHGPREDRSLSIRITPFVSVADAQSSMPNLLSRVLWQPFTTQKITRSQSIAHREIIGLSELLVHEVETVGGVRGPQAATLVAGTIGELLVTFIFWALEELWPWREALQIANSQVAKIEHSLSHEARAQ